MFVFFFILFYSFIHLVWTGCDSISELATVLKRNSAERIQFGFTIEEKERPMVIDTSIVHVLVLGSYFSPLFKCVLCGSEFVEFNPPKTIISLPIVKAWIPRRAVLIDAT